MDTINTSQSNLNLSEKQRALSQKSYRDILKSQLVERLSRNPGYSLRAYARDLGLKPSHLSQILNNKKGISVLIAHDVVKKLNLSDQDAAFFINSVEFLHSRNVEIKNRAKKELDSYQLVHNFKLLSLDEFSLISDWYYLAIIEMLKISNTEVTASNLAKKLGIDSTVVNLAIEKLVSLGLVDDNNGLKINNSQYGTGREVPSKIIQNYHSQILQMAQNALTNQSVNERDFTANTIAVNKNKLPEIKEKIMKFQEEMDQYIENTEDKNSVYCLSIQFFELLKH